MNQARRNIDDKLMATCFGVAIASGLAVTYGYTLGVKAANIKSSLDEPADLPAADSSEDSADDSPDPDGGE